MITRTWSRRFQLSKGDYTYPQVCDSAEHAAEWVEGWVDFYNYTRYHPGLGNFTPCDVLEGTWKGTWGDSSCAADAVV